MNIDSGLWNRRESVVGGSDDRPPRSKKRIFILLGVLAIGVVAWFLLGGKKAEPVVETPPPSVTVIVPGRHQVMNTVTATGTLAARRNMPVGVAGEGGMVSRVLVEQGSWVKAGQVLATIDRSVQAQQANQMRAQVVAADADARIAQANLDRSQKLLARGFVSKADIDQKSATRDAAQARVGVTRAQYGEMNARLARLDIRAPASGLVMQRAVEAGQIVSAGGPALFNIAMGGEMEVLARLAEADLAHVHVGSAAKVVPVGTTTEFSGAIWQLSPMIDAVSRQGVARVALAYNSALRPGGFASVSISTGAGDVPLLPESAVMSDANGNFVYIVGKDDRVSRRQVKVGDVDDRGVSIVGGLNGAERVVASAGAFLNPGDKIVPQLAPTR